MALDDRKLEVLRAIVEDYVETQEPVGSKALVERRLVELPAPLPDSDVLRMPTAINEKSAGVRLSDRPPLVHNLLDECEPALRQPMVALSTVLLETLVERTDERIALAGTANL